MHKLEVNDMMLTRIRALPARAGRLARAALALTIAAVVVACGGGTTPVTGVSTLRPLPAVFTDSATRAVNYSPFRTFNRDTEVITKANIKQDMDLLVAGGFNLIRLFDSSDMVARQTLEVIRDNTLPIKVQLGAYLQGFSNSKGAANDAEAARCIVLANQFSAIVVAVSVGNEMLEFDFNKIDDPKTLAGYITTVRNAISQPVTTDDTYLFWNKAQHTITDAIDYVSMHSYVEADTIFAEGLWDWQQLATAPGGRAFAMMDAAIAATKNQYQSVRVYLDSAGLSAMPITIGETGWHAVNTGTGLSNLPFRASAANQKMYYDRLRAWEAATRSTTGPRAVFYFEAFDEPWKLADNFWALFTVERKARCAIQALNPASATWVYDMSQSCDEANAVYFVELSTVLTPVVTANRFVLYSDATVAGVDAVLPAAVWDAFGNNAGGVTAGIPPVTTTAAPGDSPASIEITPTPADYGWGVLRHSSNGVLSNLSQFGSGTLYAWIRTNNYPGKIQIGISTDTEDRKGAEAILLLSPGDYQYCTTDAWCQVAIPISAFLAVNPKLDLRAVLIPFEIRDIYSETGKPLNTTGLPKVYVDGIYWSK